MRCAPAWSRSLPRRCWREATTARVATRGGNDVSIVKFRPDEAAAPAIPYEVQAIVAAANAGDRSALPALRKALADHPELIDKLGDLAAHAEMALVSLVAGPSLAGSEAVAAHL